MTDWVVQENWAKVAVGDQVRVRHEDGTGMLTGTISHLDYGSSNASMSAEIQTPYWGDPKRVSSLFWSLFVPAKPAVVLPTEPGWYLAFDKLANAPFPVEVDANGTMLINHAGGIPVKLGGADRFTPFIPLAPVAVTAKKAIDQFRIGQTISAVAEEFGVTE